MKKPGYAPDYEVINKQQVVFITVAITVKRTLSLFFEPNFEATEYVFIFKSSSWKMPAFAADSDSAPRTPGSGAFTNLK